MRNLIVCCDGTWNTPDQSHDGAPIPTNVVRFFNAISNIDPDGNTQLKYYHPGVGTEGNWWSKLSGGVVGTGLSKNVISAYRWLATTYQRGDRLFLLGFSRGAYTVRSLGGMIGSCGLLDLAEIGHEELWKRVNTAYTRGYRNKKAQGEWGGAWKFHGTGTPPRIKIYFMGVWDTVGALGIPNDLAILNLLDNVNRYSFHDAGLSDRIVNARHAVAIDERRASFAPTLWEKGGRRKTVKQVWFPGVHSDVGGGYPEIGLSDGALKWMMDEARALGLGLREGMYAQVIPNSRGVLHDSFTGVFQHLRSEPRAIPLLASENADVVHESALDRYGNPPIAQSPYRPTVRLARSETRSLPVYSADRWNDTGLFLEAKTRYRFTATGQWLDRSIKCGPGGTHDGRFQAGELIHMAGSLWGKLEGVFKKVSRNEEADFKGTRREESLPWFSLVGVVANGGQPSADGRRTRHEIIAIGEGCDFTPAKSGYLYAFANDAWHFYGNNRGAVALSVERLT